MLHTISVLDACKCKSAARTGGDALGYVQAALVVDLDWQRASGSGVAVAAKRREARDTRIGARRITGESLVDSDALGSTTGLSGPTSTGHLAVSFPCLNWSVQLESTVALV